MLKRIILVAALIIAVPVFAMGGRPEKKDPMLGIAAPEFVLDTIYNGTKKLSEVRAGRKAIIFFWATWCPHCHEQLQRINNSADSLKRRGYAIILVNLGEASNDAKAFLEFNRIKIDSFVDPDSSLQDLYHVEGVPTLYYLDEKGNILSQQHQFEGSMASLNN